MECSRCKSKNIIKSGTVRDKQRFKCKDCNYYFTINQKKIPENIQRLAIHLYLEGFSYRAISNIVGVSDVSIASWIKPIKSDLDNCRPNKLNKSNLHEIEHFMLSRNLFKKYGWLIIGFEQNQDIRLLGCEYFGNLIYNTE